MPKPSGTRINPKAITTVETKTHSHPLPLCGDGKHDLSCKTHGYELKCFEVIVIDPHTLRANLHAVCVHLFT